MTSQSQRNCKVCQVQREIDAQTHLGLNLQILDLIRLVFAIDKTFLVFNYFFNLSSSQVIHFSFCWFFFGGEGEGD